MDTNQGCLAYSLNRLLCIVGWVSGADSSSEWLSSTSLLGSLVASKLEGQRGRGRKNGEGKGRKDGKGKGEEGWQGEGGGRMVRERGRKHCERKHCERKGEGGEMERELAHLTNIFVTTVDVLYRNG